MSSFLFAYIPYLKQISRFLFHFNNFQPELQNSSEDEHKLDKLPVLLFPLQDDHSFCTPILSLHFFQTQLPSRHSSIMLYTVPRDASQSRLLAKATLEKALLAEKPAKGLILHSDQGCQFTSWDFIHYCESRGICQSMSKAGCPYDNAPMERFYNTLKNELIYPNHFYDAASLDEALNRYVYVWYNHVRPHSYNDWKTPFEARYVG